MKKGNYFWGAIFVLAAVCVLLGKLELFDSINFFMIIATIFLVAFIMKSIAKKSWSGILFPIAFLAILYDDILGIEDLTPFPALLAALLGSIGLSLLFPGKKRDDVRIHSNCQQNFGNTFDSAVGQYVKFENTFGSSIKYVNSVDFRSASLENAFGSLIVYFDHANIVQGQAYIDVDVSFGSMTMYIPASWNVVNNIDTSFGSVEEKGAHLTQGTPVVTLSGDCAFASIKIIYI